MLIQRTHPFAQKRGESHGREVRELPGTAAQAVRPGTSGIFLCPGRGAPQPQLVRIFRAASGKRERVPLVPRGFGPDRGRDERRHDPVAVCPRAGRTGCDPGGSGTFRRAVRTGRAGGAGGSRRGGRGADRAPAARAGAGVRPETGNGRTADFLHLRHKRAVEGCGFDLPRSLPERLERAEHAALPGG